jgi:regulator of CtrA degradation
MMEQRPFIDSPISAPVQKALVANLYVEAMLLADEAYTAFASQRDMGRGGMDRLTQVGLACESLKTTTRLMHIIAWLLHRRAMMANEPGALPQDSAAHIGDVITADWEICIHFDSHCRHIVAGSERLFERIAKLEAGWDDESGPARAPVQQMLAGLEARL